MAEMNNAGFPGPDGGSTRSGSSQNRSTEARRGQATFSIVQSTLRTRGSLTDDIWRACDILRRDDNCGGVMAYVEHLAWLLFLRFLDAQEQRWEAEAGASYAQILDGDLRWSAWARKDWEADELLPFVHGRLIPTLQALSGSAIRETIQGIFSERNVIVAASPHNLRDVLAIVDRIDFYSQDDIFTVSRVYEDLLQRLGDQNRVAGEFYTPRPVIRFVVQLVDPQPDETIYDPACGSCGFLVQAYQHVLAQAAASLTVEQEQFLQTRAFYGQEKKAVPALLGLMNLVLHGVSAPNVARRNTLQEHIGNIGERYDVILTNPPFGGTENRQIQANFPVRTNATELLFLQHIVARLETRDGARCGMVVPEGVLFRGGAFATVKRELLERFNLHTIISLPSGTFAPYSDVKTALLFFEQPGPTRETWYYELPMPADLKKFSKGSPIQDEHFDRARALWAVWDAYRRGAGPRPAPTDDSWIVPLAELESRDYDLTARNSFNPEQETYRHPQKIALALLQQEQEIVAISTELLDTIKTGAKDTAELSAAWEWKPLAEPGVAEIILGQSPPSTSYNDHGAGLPFFQGKADFGELYPIPRKWCTDPIKIARPGDVLISVRAPVGPTNLCAETCCIGRGLAALRPGAQMEPKFLLFVMRALEPEIARKGQGSTFAGITKRDLEHLQVPVPALDEQAHVVAYLDGLQARLAELKRRQDESAADLDRLNRAVLARAFKRRSSAAD
jgi:type I restriction enzyme M protein